MLGKFKSINLLKRVFTFPRHFCVYFPLFCSPQKSVLFCLAEWKNRQVTQEEEECKKDAKSEFFSGEKAPKNCGGRAYTEDVVLK